MAGVDLKAPPPVAYIEDYDDSEKVAKPSSRVHARIDKTPASKGAHKTNADSKRRDAASDSGYSSFVSSTAIVDADMRRAVSGGSSKKSDPEPSQSRMAVQRTKSDKPTPKTSSRSASKARHCTSSRCEDPTCAASKNPERRYTLPHQIPRQAPVQPPQQGGYVQPPPDQYFQYQQAPAPASASAVPRRLSTSSHGRARPLSFHDYGNAGSFGLPSPQAHGPPPSPSAYHNFRPPPQLLNTSVPPPGYAMTSYSAPAVPTTTTALAATPIYTTNQNPAFAPISARHVTPDRPMLDTMAAPGPHALTRAISARQPSKPAKQEYRSDSGSGSEFESEYDSDSSYSSAEARRRQHRHDSRRMPPPPRPAIRERRTEPWSASPKLSQHPHRRSYDVDAAYYSSTEQFDSDRTVRPPIDRATESSYSGGSRRPSLATTTSSYRTRATSVSNESRHDERYSHGKESRRSRHDASLQDSAEAYQRRVNGHHQPRDIPLDEIRHKGRYAVASHISRRSSTHSSSKSRQEPLQIVKGDTLIQIYGEATVEMRAGDEGGPSSLIINESVNGGEHGGSRASGSHLGRHRARSEMRRPRDVDGYEPAL